MVKEFRDVDALTSADFEVFVRDVFLAAGWSDAYITEVGREFKHGDGGVDIFAYKGGRKFAIEVKQRNLKTTVDVKALNQLVTGAALQKVSNKILVTNSYFTSEVKVRALRLGVELIDRDELQNLWVVKQSEIGRDIRPRKYQQFVIDTAVEAHERGKRKILIEMATGLGKTYTVAHLVKSLVQSRSKSWRVLFLAHQVEILLQSVTAFKNVLGIGNYSFSACFDGAKPEGTDFVFASFDTLYGQLSDLIDGEFTFIIVDEAHHTPAKTYAEVVTKFTPELLVGLTATPYRADNASVIDFFGGDEGHIGRFDLVWALKHRKLAFPKYLVLLDDLDQEKIDQLESGLTVSDIDRRLFLHKKDEEVVRIIERTVNDKGLKHTKGIVFCRNIRHMKHLLGFFSLGDATLVHSKMTDQERRENIRNFREGDCKYILVCDLFNEGVDIPETNILVFMRRTSSRTIWLQQLGRGLRKTPNKEYVHVLDFVGSLERLSEVKALSEQVERTRVNHTYLIDDECEHDKKQIMHDGSLEVRYSKQAAKVLELIENLQMRLNSRSVLIDKLRKYRRDHALIPKIEALETSLVDVGCDQISTHFDSYLGYIQAAFGSSVGMAEARGEIFGYIDSYSKDHKLPPSPKVIELKFNYKRLCKFTEMEIRVLIGDELERSRVGDDGCLQSSGKVGSTKAHAKSSVLLDGQPQCEILDKYKHLIQSRADMQKLPLEELNEIKMKYRSASVFLKKLRNIQQGV